MERWVGKVAVVTGASSGIGQAIAEKLVENGLKVVGLARRQDKLDNLKAKISTKPGKFYGLKTDMTIKEDIIAAFDWIQNNIGVVSILVNNAGVSTPGSVTEGNFEAWERMFKTNLQGLTIASSIALQTMKENDINDGHIINMSSVAGRYVLDVDDYSIYGATKHAVTAFTLALRKELAHSKSKIRVTNISPGLVTTELTMTPEYEKYGVSHVPMLQAEDVANVVVFAIACPAHVQVTELTVQPTGETY